MQESTLQSTTREEVKRESIKWEIDLVTNQYETLLPDFTTVNLSTFVF